MFYLPFGCRVPLESRNTSLVCEYTAEQGIAVIPREPLR